MKKRTKLILSLVLSVCVAIGLVGGLFLFKQEPQNQEDLNPVKTVTEDVVYAGYKDDTGASSASLMEKGGLFFVANGTTYNMTGGKYNPWNNEARYGGAVYVESGGTFVMSGGEISGFSAEYGSAIYVEAGGTCVIKGGEIKENSSETGSSVHR